jgi:hypothetical protein
MRRIKIWVVQHHHRTVGPSPSIADSNDLPFEFQMGTLGVHTDQQKEPKKWQAGVTLGRTPDNGDPVKMRAPSRC